MKLGGVDCVGLPHAIDPRPLCEGVGRLGSVVEVLLEPVGAVLLGSVFDVFVEGGQGSVVRCGARSSRSWILSKVSCEIQGFLGRRLGAARCCFAASVTAVVKAAACSVG